MKQLKITLANEVNELVIECWKCEGGVYFKLGMQHPKIINSPLDIEEYRIIGFEIVRNTCVCLKK